MRFAALTTSYESTRTVDPQDVVGTAIPLLACNVVLMYFSVFRGA